VNFSVSGKAGAQYRLDLGSWSGFAVDYNVPIATDGNHRIDYNFTDNAGNSGAGTVYAAHDSSAVSVSYTNPGAVWQNADFNVSFDVTMS
jgi:hypothetical protein